MGTVWKRANTWYILYRYQGKSRMKAIGKTKRDAENALKDIEGRLVRGDSPGIYETQKKLFAEFCDEYLTYSKTNKSPSSYERDRYSIKELLAAFNGLYLHQIEPHKIEQYKTIRSQKAKPATVNKELNCLRAMFNRAIEWKYANVNPVRGLKFMKEPPGRLRYLSLTAENNEYEKLMAACDSQLRSIVTAAFNTGMRLGELVNLGWEQIDFKAGVIKLHKTKNNETRIIPINNDMMEVLKERQKYRFRSEYVFSNDGEPLKWISGRFRKAAKRAELKDFRFHDLRHTFASHLVMSGVDLRAVQTLLGHKDLKMTMRYSHLSDAHLKDAVKRLDGISKRQKAEAEKSG